jgi:hypothetical protein
MGFYACQEIPASVADEFGRRFVYAGVAPRKPNGMFDVDALATGEFIVPPGLIYRWYVGKGDAGRRCLDTKLLLQNLVDGLRVGLAA